LRFSICKMCWKKGRYLKCASESCHSALAGNDVRCRESTTYKERK
jgi:hypothetical protein